MGSPAAPPSADFPGPTASVDGAGAEALARAQAPLRRAVVAVTGQLVDTRGWERLGFARLRDYATE